MTARDVLHRLVDDLDEDDAKLFASVADSGPGRSTLLTLLVSQPPPDVRRQIVSALAEWHGGPETADAARTRRERAVADALGSVRAEGLEPSAAALRDATDYEAGRMTAEDLYDSALRRAHSTTRR